MRIRQLARRLLACAARPVRRPLRRYKYRTMSGPTDALGVSAATEARTSKIGSAIGRARLDELFQLVNVLAGKMSLIGPRPLLPSDQPDDADQRLRVRPGVTGWA